MKFTFIILTILMASNATAQTSSKLNKSDTVKKKTKMKKPLTRKNKNFVDHVHATLSNDILRVANSIDNFFGTDRSDDESNSTRLRIYTVTTKYEAQNPSTLGNVKIQLVLPKTQRRLQLIVESDDDDDNDQLSGSAAATNPSGANSSTNNSSDPNAAQRAANATSAALRYIVDTAGIRTSFDAGIRITTKPQVFYKVRFRRNVRLNPKWVFRPVEQIKWVQDEGHTSDTDLDFDRSISKTWSFRFQNNIFWNDQDYIVSFTNGPSWFQRINEKIGMSYNFRAYSANTPEYAVNNYALSVGFRQLLYKKWFFWTVTPALNFPRENNFHRTPALTVRFDAILGSI